EKAARAVFETKCGTCHGDTRMSDLDLRDRATILKGGKRGPAVVPGKADQSLLYKAIRREGELQMPPGKIALSAPEVNAIRDWINAGAKWDSKGTSTGAGQSWWSFKKPVRPAPPAVKNAARARNPIDAFILAKVEEKGLNPAPEADRRTLARRAYFDLHGLPPTPEQVEQFVNDQSPDAYQKLIDRLLASPRYGERWGRYWLDLVRYADTSGFETDHFYTTAWRYRDWVISSFNTDKPYNTFVQEQIAADELWSTSVDLEGTLKLPKEKEENLNRRIGTALFTLGAFPIEYTYYGDQYRAEWQADAVDTVGAAFLGLTVGCARCHDHKFDPITERDYYRMSALFAGSVEREIPLGSLFDVQTATRSFPLLEHSEVLKRMSRGGGRGRGGSKGGGGRGARAGQQQQQQEQAQTDAMDGDIPPPAARGPVDPQRAAMLQQLAEAYLRAPGRMPYANVLGHEEVVPDTHMLFRGDFKKKGEKVEPGFLSALHHGPAIEEPKGFLFVPQRRKALALWLTSPENPLLGRVMVNRIWQGHFGKGIVSSPNDFGRQGEAPTHPELLDWLTVEFAERGWSIKQIHRLIMLSGTYRASSVAGAESLNKDPENYFLSRMNRRRLDGDALRDNILAVAGTLNLKTGGVGVIPPLTAEEIQAARMPQLWPANPDPAEHNRRSIYLQMKRSLTLPMLAIFDAPDTASSCPRRETSTVAPQALALMNGDIALKQSEQFAGRVAKLAGDNPDAAVDTGWKLAFGRPPTADEKQTALDYLKRNSLQRLCQLMFNMSEFIYVD
ncbi:MAG: PSD1 and planctomycete cytochrome C domain-containing protein, partial [Bryobacteraceae bacterium]